MEDMASPTPSERLAASAVKAASRAATIAKAAALVAKHAKAKETAAATAASASAPAPSATPPAPAAEPPSAELVAAAEAALKAQAINKAKHSCRLGWARLALQLPPYAAKRRPRLITRQENNRDAPEANVRRFIEKCEVTVGGVDRDNWKFAVVMLAKAEDIDNLDEIKGWAPQSSEPMIDILWTPGTTAAAHVMELLNGWHRWKAVQLLLEAKFQRLADLEKWTAEFRENADPTDKAIAYQEKSKQERAEIWEAVEENSMFPVELYDVGKFLSTYVNERIRWLTYLLPFSLRQDQRFRVCQRDPAQLGFQCRRTWPARQHLPDFDQLLTSAFQEHHIRCETSQKVRRRVHDGQLHRHRLVDPSTHLQDRDRSPPVFSSSEHGTRTRNHVYIMVAPRRSWTCMSYL